MLDGAIGRSKRFLKEASAAQKPSNIKFPKMEKIWPSGPTPTSACYSAISTMFASRAYVDTFARVCLLKTPGHSRLLILFLQSAWQAQARSFTLLAMSLVRHLGVPCQCGTSKFKASLRRRSDMWPIYVAFRTVKGVQIKGSASPPPSRPTGEM
ncbi:hypothetical protein BDZ97DRAFT_139473 [Flammula alnicola]|nr:hypothetical protein BDZ97DRAFT_139473 [Flammula alnicola]